MIEPLDRNWRPREFALRFDGARIMPRTTDADVFEFLGWQCYPTAVEKTSGERGFTLLEILIVVAIIGLIASIVAPNLLGRFESSKQEIGKAQLEVLSSGVQSFYLDVGRCPTSLNELVASTDKKWKGPYLSKKTVPLDQWGREYQYKCPGDHGTFDLYSLGASGKLDDQSITNW